MEKLWDFNATLTTRLVDAVTTPMLIGAVQSGRLQPGKLVAHRFAMGDILNAYDTFGKAARDGALKVVLNRGSIRSRRGLHPFRRGLARGFRARHLPPTTP